MSSETPSGTGLWDRLTGAARPHRGVLRVWEDGGYQEYSWSETVRAAERTTAGLRRAGVRPGTRVAAVLTNTFPVVAGMLGVWLAGGAVASLPVPARGMHPGEYGRQLALIGAQLDPAVFLVQADLIPTLPDELAHRSLSWESLLDSGTVEATPPGEDDVAFVQYSSGSTSAPKGCVLTPRAIAAQLEIISELIDVRPGVDGFASWLPLSHDMGLFGGLLHSWAADMDLALSNPERFGLSPGTWFGDMARFGARSSAGTNTALHLAARAAARSGRMPADGLRTVEHCIIGAEQVQWSTLQVATSSLAPYGLRPGGIVPAYGLAEATLAVTYTPDDEPFRRVVVDTGSLADGELVEVEHDHPSGASIVSAGRPCRGVSLEMTEGSTLQEVVVRSPSLASGYWADPGRTATTFRDGALHTADLGFVRDGHLYPVGRTDDMISVAGRKVYAREVEHAVDALKGARRGCSTLVDQLGGPAEGLTLFIEVASAKARFPDLAEEAATTAMEKAAVTLDRCVFLKSGSLPKTPSGKIQRHRCRSMFESGRFEPLATVDLAR